VDGDLPVREKARRDKPRHENSRKLAMRGGEKTSWKGRKGPRGAEEGPKLTDNDWGGGGTSLD